MSRQVEEIDGQVKNKHVLMSADVRNIHNGSDLTELIYIMYDVLIQALGAVVLLRGFVIFYSIFV